MIVAKYEPSPQYKFKFGGGLGEGRGRWGKEEEEGGGLRAASLPDSRAIRFCSSMTVGSSPMTSSPTRAAAIAARMAWFV